MRPEHWLFTIPLRLRSLFRWSQADQELEDELRDHLERKTEEYVSHGMTQEEARRRARIDLGGIEQTREKCRDARKINWIQDFVRDLHFGLRMLRKSPGFTAVAILTLALGIGANTGMFTLLKVVMLQSIPVRNSNELVVLRWSANKQPQHSGFSSFGDCPWRRWTNEFSGGCVFTYPMFEEIREHSQVFSGVSAFAGPAPLDLSGNGRASIVQAELISGDYFKTLGVSAAAGRTIEPRDEKPGADAVTVLSYAYWQGAFGGVPSAIGKSIKLNGVPFTIVGVAEQGFTRLTPGHSQDMWLPLTQKAALRIPWGGPPEKPSTSFWLVVIGRRKPGVTEQQAGASASALFRNLVVDEKVFKPEDDPKVAAVPAQKALSGIRAELEQPLYILMAAVGIVLLISCANVAGLMLSRAAAREKEMAARLALGAGRPRVIRQLLTESVQLWFAGAALGVVFAYWGAPTLAAFVSANRHSPFQIKAEPDARVLAFAVTVAALTGILFGLVPAFRGTRVNVAPVLKENAGSMAGASFTGTRRFGFGSGLVVTQVGLSVILLAGAGVVVRSLANLKGIDPGFDTHNLFQFGINPTLTGYYKTDQVDRLYRELQSRLSGLPGVSSVSYSSDTLLDGGLWSEGLKIERRTDKSNADTQMLAVGPDFLETMKIPLLRGRTLTKDDMASGRPVALVNREFVKQFLEKREPLGLRFGGTDAKDPQYEIVGVVGDTKYARLRDAIAPTAYVPLKEKEAHFALRTSVSPQALLPAVRKVVSDLDNNVPIFDVRTQTERIDRLLFNERLLARLASLFGMLALILACLGIYGLLSYEVSRRTREIGIRSAFGAHSQDVLWLVGRQGLAVVILGAAVGVLAALWVTRTLGSLLYGVHPSDPMTFLWVCALLATVGLAACYIPARRAMRVDPMVALRYE
ncbi:MAG: ABC transporter permease [Acidobacteria bacterium]|nr:ABC transporter permease [Acidobacteriota bacterium]